MSSPAAPLNFFDATDFDIKDPSDVMPGSLAGMGVSHLRPYGLGSCGFPWGLVVLLGHCGPAWALLAHLSSCGTSCAFVSQAPTGQPGISE